MHVLGAFTISLVAGLLIYWIGGRIDAREREKAKKDLEEQLEYSERYFDSLKDMGSRERRT